MTPSMSEKSAGDAGGTTPGTAGRGEPRRRRAGAGDRPAAALMVAAGLLLAPLVVTARGAAQGSAPPAAAAGVTQGSAPPAAGASAAQESAAASQAPQAPVPPDTRPKASDQVPSALEVPHAYEDYTLPAPAGPDPMLPRVTDAKGAGIDPAALTHLLLRARLFHSDALVVLKDGRLVEDQRFGNPAEPIEVMSVTKSIVGIGIGHLLFTHRLPSLDTPVSTWYPEWSRSAKRSITLRQLLNHTSGLAAQPSADEIYSSDNLVKLALDADLAHFPGTHFFYNNKAVNLLAGIVEKVSGKKLDLYMRDEIFAPLGITRFSWMRDPAGNPHVLAGLKLDARDLARLGQLMLDGGTYNGKRLLSQAFVDESVRAAQPYSPTGGLLWWVLPEWTRLTIDRPLLDTWRKGGADPAFLAAIEPLVGRPLSRDELFAALDRIFGHEQAAALWVRNVAGRDLQTPKVTAGPAYGFDANGYLGQYLVVIPASHIVAVRQIRASSQKSTGDDFDDFPQVVRALTGAAPAAASPARTPSR